MKTFSALALIILSTFSHLLNVIDTLATMIISSSCIQHIWCKCAHHHTFLIPCGRPVLTSTLGTEGRRETQKAQGRREDVRGRRTGQIDLILNSKSFDSPNKHYLVHGYDWIFFFNLRLCTLIHKILVTLLSWNVFYRFWYQGCTMPPKWIRKVPSSILWKRSWELPIISFLNIWNNCSESNCTQSFLSGQFWFFFNIRYHLYNWPLVWPYLYW